MNLLTCTKVGYFLYMNILVSLFVELRVGLSFFFRIIVINRQESLIGLQLEILGFCVVLKVWLNLLILITDSDGIL